MARRHDDDRVSGGQDVGDGLPEVFPEILPEVSDDLDEESFRRLSSKRRVRLWRQRIVLVAIVVVVLAVGAGALLVYTDRWQPEALPTPSAAATPLCAPAEPAPATPADVTVDVLNGTDRQGLAGTVATRLRSRGFVVGTVGNAPAPVGPATAVVTYPPGQLQQALAVAARFEASQLVEDPGATSVSLRLGDGFEQLLGEDALVVPTLSTGTAAAGC